MGASDPNTQVEDILKGAFDLHVHAGPDPGQARRMDALDTARHAHESEMAGFVLKSHHNPTAPVAHALNRIYPGLQVAGSITLNKSVGGLNADAVEVAAALGARVVWMPTYDAHFYRSSRGQGPGIPITNENGGLVPQLKDVVDVARQHDLALASGHVSPEEALALFRAAREVGVSRLIATHPSGTATVQQMREMGSLGAYLEMTFLSCMPATATTNLKNMVATIKELGPERCVVTTDFGQWTNPPPAEGMRMAIASLLDAGLSALEVSTLVKANPLRLVGADA